MSILLGIIFLIAGTLTGNIEMLKVAGLFCIAANISMLRATFDE